MPTPPALDAEKRQAGYQRSLALRRTRAEFKAQLASEGWRYLAEHWELEDIQGMRVFDLLKALPGIGTSRAYEALNLAGIHPSRTVARCGARQRDRLLELLDS